MKNKALLGVICSVSSAVLFGITPLLAKSAGQYGYTSFMIAFSRFALGAVFLFVIVKLQGERIRLSARILWRVLLVSVFYSLMILLMYTAYEYIDSGLTTTLHFSYPVFVVVITVVFKRRAPSVKELAAVLLAVTGIALLHDFSASLNIIGAVLALLSGLSYAVYIVLTESLGLDKLPVFVLSFWMSAFSSATVGITLFFTPKTTIDWSPSGILLLTILAVTTNVLAIVLFQKGLFLCGGVKASLLSTFEPLTSVVIGLTVFSESLTVINAVGVFLVLLSTFVIVIGKNSFSDSDDHVGK